MRIIEPDFDRVVDLSGAGPTPRPVDVDQASTGFADPLSLCIDEVADGTVVDGDAAGDEVLMALLAGAVTIEVTGAHEATFTLQADGDWAAYLPPHHRYRLTPLAPATVAFARTRSDGIGPPRAFAPLNGVLAVEEGPSRLRLRLLALAGETDASAGLGDDVERLAHVTGPATIDGRDLPPAHTVALSPGERARVTGEGELLVVAALGP